MRSATASSPRALIIAEAANPDWPSVPLVGWSHAAALARVADVHVVTQVRNRDSFVRSGWREGVDFTAIDSEAAARPLWHFDQALRSLTGLGWTTTTALSALPYYYFEHLVWKTFAKRIQSGEFSIVHRLTPLSPTSPSIIANRCKQAGAKFIWGPINGGVPWPKGFDQVRRAEGEWLSYVRDAYKLLPGYRSTRADAAAILVGSLATRDQLSPEGRDKAIYIPENAIDPARFGRKVDRPVTTPLRVAFVGRLVPYKGADMLIEAAAPLVKEGRLVVDVIGDGPEMPRLQRLVQELDVAGGVKLDGWVPNTMLQERLVASDVFGFPSVREFGGGAVLEAMALGLAPVVVDYGGPAELVTETTGFRVPLGTREEIIARVRVVLGKLAAEPARARAIGERARARVFSLFTWDHKARQTLAVYSWVRGEGPRPDFGAPFPDGVA
ncbi:MAG TPA: glycosyltransferase family 4 protein [Polyangia bacterium]|nr:glycosyltransferase family 4 protein [Polyangia bacterium]HVZ85336.1 glycosyltransferase family 4 protein [Polyangia bacterium]